MRAQSCPHPRRGLVQPLALAQRKGRVMPDELRLRTCRPGRLLLGGRGVCPCLPGTAAKTSFISQAVPHDSKKTHGKNAPHPVAGKKWTRSAIFRRWTNTVCTIFARAAKAHGLLFYPNAHPRRKRGRGPRLNERDTAMNRSQVDSPRGWHASAKQTGKFPLLLQNANQPCTAWTDDRPSPREIKENY